jgi:hypothetical protein
LLASKSLSPSAIYGIYGSYWQCFASELKPVSPGSADPDPDQKAQNEYQTSMLKELYGALKASPGAFLKPFMTVYSNMLVHLAICSYF